MVWDTSSPAGSDAIASGDDNIRELKTDLQSALRGDDTEGVEAIFPGSDTSAPAFRYRGLKGNTAARPASGQYGLYSNTTLNTLQRDNGTTWDDIATLIPSGTVMVFYQAAAPVGWTKIITQDDKALRVVSGGSGGSAGGTQSLSTPIALAHTHTVVSHTHTITHQHVLPVAGDPAGFSIVKSADWDGGSASESINHQGVPGTYSVSSVGLMKTRQTDTASSGATAPATDSQLSNVSLAYVDVILASKD